MNPSMEHSFWQSRWDSRRIGFHAADINPRLVRHWPASKEGTGRVLVPLCGKSLDLRWLAQRGHQVVGVEFVERALQEFFEEASLVPSVSQQGDVTSYQAGPYELHRADFFGLKPERIAACDWVYDRAALVAIAPDRREDYVRQIHALTNPGARMLLLSFEHDIPSGPPFSIPRDEVRKLFEPHFELALKDEHDVLEQQPQFRERGASEMRELAWLAKRR